MSKRPQTPPSPEARETLLSAISATAEPIAARSLAKLLPEPHRIREAVLVPILDEYVTAGRLHAYPPKTAKGKPRYWDRDALALSRAAALDAVQRAESPLTAKELARWLTAPLKLTEGELIQLLDESVAARTVYAIPAATPKSKPRYWNRSVLEFGRLTIRKSLEMKGPQAEAQLRKSLKMCSDVEFQQIVETAIAAGDLWRHPPLGKSKKEFLGSRPPSPEPYLQDVGFQLTQVVSRLIAANVPREELRRSLVQMIEAAGVPFAAAAPTDQASPPARSVSEANDHRASLALQVDMSNNTLAAQSGAPPAPPVDLIALMRRIEPGADRGALVGSRDLRRAAQLDKPQFDRAVLELARQGRLALHRHDYAASLSPADRDELVTDGLGTYYVGMALRQPDA